MLLMLVAGANVDVIDGANVGAEHVAIENNDSDEEDNDSETSQSGENQVPRPSGDNPTQKSLAAHVDIRESGAQQAVHYIAERTCPPSSSNGQNKSYIPLKAKSSGKCQRKKNKPEKGKNRTEKVTGNKSVNEGNTGAVESKSGNFFIELLSWYPLFLYTSFL